MSELKKIWLTIWLLAVIIITGTIGYMIIEGLSFFEALYMAIITISTVGFQEVKDLSEPGRLFTIFVIMGGLGTAAYALTSITTFVVEGEFRGLVRRRRMERRIAELENHYIICGAGKTGKHTVARMEKSKMPFVVIEKDPDKVHELEEDEILVIHGDATHEDVLNRARIDKAKGLITALSSDAENVYTVLTARQMAPNLYIVARAIEENSSTKLRKAGADNTVSPDEIGGYRMASLVIRPAIVSFLDIITRAKDVTLDLEEVKIEENSPLVGQSLADVNIPCKTGLVIMAINRVGQEEIMFNPGPDYVLHEGDSMVVLGQEDQINRLREISCSILCQA